MVTPAAAQEPLTCKDLNYARQKDDSAMAFAAGYALASFHEMAKDIERPADSRVMDFIFAYCETYGHQTVPDAAREAYRHFRLVSN